MRISPHLPGHGVITSQDRATGHRPDVHENAGDWAPDGWLYEVPGEDRKVTFFRLDVPAVVALSVAYNNGGYYMYSQPMVEGDLAVYGVIDAEGNGAGTLYQAAVRRKDGQVEPAFENVIGSNVLSAPQHVQDALAAFIAALHDAKDDGTWPSRD